MNQEPNIQDMTANGYVRCGGCGGYLPAGAICGLCLQRQNGPSAQPAKSAKPLRTAFVLALCALVVCGIGLCAAFVVKGAAKVTRMSGTNNSPLAGLIEPGSDGAATMGSASDRKLVDALSSGDTQQALAAMEAQGTSPASTMQASGTGAEPPVMQSSAPASTSTMQTQSATMPDNVRKWLEHLQKIEQARIALSAGQLQDSVRTLTGLKADDANHGMEEEGDDNKAAEEKRQDERASRVGGDMQSMQKAWRTLASAFDSLPPPAECVGIKANYDQVIGQTGSMILDIVGHIKSAKQDPQAAIAALTAMQGQSKAKIDAPSRATDEGVASVCRKYDTSKWFDIQNDVGSGVMSQLGL